MSPKRLHYVWRRRRYVCSAAEPTRKAGHGPEVHTDQPRWPENGSLIAGNIGAHVGPELYTFVVNNREVVRWNKHKRTRKRRADREVLHYSAVVHS